MSDSISNLRSPATTSPFDLTDERAYQCWREWKLSDYPGAAEDLIVSVANPFRLSPAEKQALLSRCQKANAAIYRISTGDFADKELVASLGHQFGLVRLDRNLRADEDSITSLKVVSEDSRCVLHTLYQPAPQLAYRRLLQYTRRAGQGRGAALCIRCGGRRRECLPGP